MSSFFGLFDFAGDPGEPDYFYDQAEFDAQKRNRDRYLGDLKSERTRMRGDRDFYRGRERSLQGQAGRQYGLAERAIDSTGRYIGRAGRLTDAASQLATDGSYRDTAQRIRGREGQLDDIRRQVSGIRQQMGRPLNVGNSVYSALLRDAMTSFYTAEKNQLDTQLANSNLTPAAQMAMRERLARGAVESIGKAEVQGFLSQEDADMRRFLNQTQLLGTEANLVQSGISAIINEQDIRRAQQSDLMNAASGQLNVGTAQMNQASQMAGMGDRYANQARAASDNMRFYDSAQLGVTEELLGDARERMSTQQQLQMQDAANRQAYNTYKAQSGQRGFNNLMNIARTGARIYTAAATGGASEAAIAATDLATTAAQSQIPMDGRSNYSGVPTINRANQINYNNQRTSTNQNFVGSRNMTSMYDPYANPSRYTFPSYR